MPITDLLERNSKLYGEEIALVEINPEIQEAQRVTWKEYELIQPTSSVPYRRAIARSTLRNSSSVLKGEGISTTKPSSAYSGSTPHSRKP